GKVAFITGAGSGIARSASQLFTQQGADDPDAPAATPRTQFIKSQLQRYPFSVGEPEDIAQVALFLASDEARMLTGVILPADGGLSSY
ncbi:MAG: SDR family oxidoreductase, partial [Desulfurellaceae bacterium]|nr:SDR family oxidoreductase [Desulfurellaceae bacterium]